MDTALSYLRRSFFHSSNRGSLFVQTAMPYLYTWLFLSAPYMEKVSRRVLFCARADTYYNRQGRLSIICLRSRYYEKKKKMAGERYVETKNNGRAGIRPRFPIISDLVEGESEKGQIVNGVLDGGKREEYPPKKRKSCFDLLIYVRMGRGYNTNIGALRWLWLYSKGIVHMWRKNLRMLRIGAESDAWVFAFGILYIHTISVCASHATHRPTPQKIP